jgi:hypothetical protein
MSSTTGPTATRSFPEKANGFSREHGLDDRFVVMHSGNVGLSQNSMSPLTRPHGCNRASG